MAKNNFYVVWRGHNTGIFSSWDECRQQINGYPGAQYKGYPTLAAAKAAQKDGYSTVPKSKTQLSSFNTDVKPEQLSICVDAACSGNPGPMEYRGVWVETGDEIFRQGPFPHANNNVGEFLAIVHGLAWLAENKMNLVLYSDSVTAISWVRNRKAKTELVAKPGNEKVFQLIKRAETWLQNNPAHAKVRKWETQIWGEIPADFGRK